MIHSFRPFQAQPPIGLTRIAELLLVDVAVVSLVETGSDLHRLLNIMFELGACVIVESTLVINLAIAPVKIREYVLVSANWPQPPPPPQPAKES